MSKTTALHVYCGTYCMHEYDTKPPDATFYEER